MPGRRFRVFGVRFKLDTKLTHAIVRLSADTRTDHAKNRNSLNRVLWLETEAPEEHGSYGNKA